MVGLFQITGILTCLLFAGAAVYINLVEHPARISCGTPLAVTVFGPRAVPMQVSLAIVAAGNGIGAWMSGGTIL